MSKPTAYSYIRFSTPEQRKGDSLRRQLELSEKWAREHGLVLDTKLKLRDLGLSAFHGDHRTKGTLGQFLKLVETGIIPRGDVLILEELDRLTRQELLEAVHLFTGLLVSGIEIHSIVDEMIYTPESFDFGQMVISAMKLSQGHEESRKKSKRLKEAWEEKRKKCSNGGLKLTGKCPAWLKLSADKKSYEKIPERAAVIEKWPEKAQNELLRNLIQRRISPGCLVALAMGEYMDGGQAISKKFLNSGLLSAKISHIDL